MILNSYWQNSMCVGMYDTFMLCIKERNNQ